MPDRELRAYGLAAAERPTPYRLAFGVSAVDERLVGNGLLASLHEVAPASCALVDDAAATLFAAGIAARLAGAAQASALWALTRFDLYAPGLEQVGLGPSALFYAQASDDKTVLAVMEDALRDGAVACVVGEVRRADRTATRRLQLAAAEGERVALLFRRWRRSGADPLAEPSAAMTRWRIGVAASGRLACPGVGRARWTVELARQRNGPSFSMILEGCDATGRLAVSADAADRAAAPAGTAARAA